MKLKDIAAKLGARLEPPAADAEITGVAAIEAAVPGEITFIANPKYAAAARNTRASAIIVDESFPALGNDRPSLRTKNPQYAYARVAEMFYRPVEYERGVHPTAVVHPSARIGANASIGAYVVIDSGVEIGENCTLLPHVVIYREVKIGRNFFAHSHVAVRENCEIGNDVLLHNGVVIGSDGFGFAKDDHGRWYKIPQSGRVVIEDEVEIQAHCCIDRASLGVTRIGRNTKIDNLTHVAHNCTVGENSMLCAQVGLAGSTEVGKNVILAGQAGVAGHCRIGDGVIVTAQSGTHGDIAPGSMVSGSPAFDHKQWRRSVALFAKLPELARAIRGGGLAKTKDLLEEPVARFERAVKELERFAIPDAKAAVGTRDFLDANDKPLDWQASGTITPDEWFFITSLYGPMSDVGERTLIRSSFGPLFVKAAKRDIRNFKPDLPGLAAAEGLLKWMRDRLCKMGEILRERGLSMEQYVEDLRAQDGRAAPENPTPALDKIVKDHQAAAAKTLSVFVRDCVLGNCFPIDRRVRKRLREYGLPDNERELVRMCLVLGKNPREIARAFYEARGMTPNPVPQGRYNL